MCTCLHLWLLHFWCTTLSHWNSLLLPMGPSSGNSKSRVSPHCMSALIPPLYSQPVKTLQGTAHHLWEKKKHKIECLSIQHSLFFCSKIIIYSCICATNIALYNSTDAFWLVRLWHTEKITSAGGNWPLKNLWKLKFQMHHFLQCFAFWMGTDPSYLKIKFKNIWVWSYMAALLIILCHLLSMLPRTKVSLLNRYLFITALSCIQMLHSCSWIRSVQFNEGVSTWFPYLLVSLCEVPIQYFLHKKPMQNILQVSISMLPNSFH